MAVFQAEAALPSLPSVRDFVLAQARQAGISNGVELKLDLVLEELLINVANHAYGDGKGNLEVECSTQGSTFCCQLRDWGAPFNPLDAPAPDITAGIDDRPIGGLGILLVSSMADSSSYKRDKDKNELTFCFSTDT